MLFAIDSTVKCMTKNLEDQEMVDTLECMDDSAHVQELRKCWTCIEHPAVSLPA